MTAGAPILARVLAATLAMLALAGAAAAQEQQTAEDWAQHVERACNGKRYGTRLAAAKKVGKGGEAALPAVLAYAGKHGRNALPVALVEAIADEAGDGPLANATLGAWAADPDFFWRAQALRGVGKRAIADESARERWLPLLLSQQHDPAWLVRTFARWGAGIEADPAEPDPRARARLAALQQDARGLIASLGDERTFLGDAWGRRIGAESARALSALLGEDAGYRADASGEHNAAALARLAAWCAERDGGPLPETTTRSDPPLAFLGGIEVLSCQRGDLFLRWTADGLVQGSPSPDCRESAQIAPQEWERLLGSAAAVALPSEAGVVVCDRMRIHLRPDQPQAAVAPGALPAGAADWLKQLAAAIEVSGQKPLADALRQRLGQFIQPAPQAR